MLTLKLILILLLLMLVLNLVLLLSLMLLILMLKLKLMQITTFPEPQSPLHLVFNVSASSSVKNNRESYKFVCTNPP